MALRHARRHGEKGEPDVQGLHCAISGVTIMKCFRSRVIAQFAAFSLAIVAPPAIVRAQVAKTVQAQTPASDLPVDGVLPKRMTIGVGKSVVIELSRDAAEVFVGNPAVANALVRSARKMYIIGAANGQTTIFATDRDGRRIAAVELTVGRDVADLGAILKTTMPTSDIQVRTVNDSVILTGSVESAVDAQKAADIASAFLGYTAVGGQANAGGAQGGGSGGVAIGGNVQVVYGNLINALTIRGKEQVMLKVTVAEVQRNVMKQLGVSDLTANGKWGTLDLATPGSLNYQVPDSTVSLSSRIGSNSINALIKAFERNGVAHVLAEPTVTAISGESAKFVAGGEIAVPNTEQCSPATTVIGANGLQQTTAGSCQIGLQFKPYGVSLSFTPVVLSEGRITLHVATEVTEIDGLQTFRFSHVNIPAFRTRKNETTVELPSGGSIATAGLIQTVSKQAIVGTPGLMNLPVIGQLFRSRDYQREETELMIVVTPYITKPLAPRDIARPDDNYTDATDPQSWLLGRVNRLYSNINNPEVIRNFKGRVGFIND
jgi:pilus assembly protein CpaC